jgi:hypothetical protein
MKEATLPHQPYFVIGLFKIGSSKLFAWGWIWTMILLISASLVARFIGVDHQCPVRIFYFLA